ncbi:MAG: hypothetical protein ACPL0B_00930 [Anaerolineales bacterium]
MYSHQKQWYILFIILLIAAGLRIILLGLGRIPFNADEAVVGLMARHILLSAERPIFFYGQAYMGSLDAYLVALAFSIFGISVWAIRCVQILLYLLVIVTSVCIMNTAFSHPNAKWVSAILLTIPPINVVLYTTVSLGGYGEALLIGNLILLNGIFFIKKLEKNNFNHSVWLSFILGGLIGLGLWINGLTLIYSIPTLLVIVWLMAIHRNKVARKNTLIQLGVFLSAFFLGSLPWWIYAWQASLTKLINELLGSAVAVETGSWIQRIGMHFFSLIILGGTVLLGLRPPWEVRWLVIPLAPLVLLIWGGIFGLWVRKLFRGRDTDVPHIMFAGILITFSIGFIFTSFGTDPSGRYFIPLWIIFAFIAGDVITTYIKNRYQQWLIIFVILAFNFGGSIACAIRYPPGITTQFNPEALVDQSKLPELMQFLLENGETRGYSNYWVAYPLAFLSNEELIFSPRLPYHADMRYTTRDDRYTNYTAMVQKSQQVAYITTKNPLLDQYLRNKFIELKISWEEITIGDFHLFYHLSKPIQVERLGLGGTYP